MTMQKTPTHLWIVGILSLLWNGFGALDYTMTQIRNAGWIETMMPDVDPQIVWGWMDSAPVYMDIFWALGVWFAVIGSVLLLMRKALAVPAFALSLIGALGGFLTGLLGAGNRPEELGGSGFDVVMLTVVVIAFALLGYARKQKANGVLA